MSRNRKLALLAIFVGTLFSGACANDITSPTGAFVDGPSLAPESPAPVPPANPVGFEPAEPTDDTPESPRKKGDAAEL